MQNDHIPLRNHPEPKETKVFQMGQITQLTPEQAAKNTLDTLGRGQTVVGDLNLRLFQQLTSLSSQIALLTQAVMALMSAIQENTEAMGGEEEEVAQTGGLLDTASDDEPEAPHL